MSRRSFAATSVAALALAFAFATLGRGALAQTSAARKGFDPTSRYATRKVEGWTVLVNKGFLKDKPELAEQVLTLLKFQLFQVERAVPSKALARLRKVRIWVEEDDPNNPCMVYHPGNLDWMREHNVNPDKSRCVEITNARRFLDWTHEQPWMVFHELSHAYHHQFLPGGYQNTDIKAAFDRMTSSRTYDSVLRINGRDDRAYALTNPPEYFAESCEAYFGTNDFYPYVRSELRRHDPAMYELLERAWGVGEKG
jgi:hypothetical protein